MRPWIVGVLALAGCPPIIDYYDDDGDGYYPPEAAAEGAEPPFDCDEGDPLINPGAVEVCDGVDNNCDEAVDDGDDRVMVYGDADADGHGVEGTSQLACALSEGWAAVADDCDDGDADRFPGNDETCDGKDEDCTGVEDDDATDATSWWLDGDGDGFGAGAAVDACEAPSKHVAKDGDCADGDADVHPDALEVCDGVDNDCANGVDVEPDVKVTWYVDGDGDGYGDDSLGVDGGCQPPAKFYSDVPGDCDDDVELMNPGLPEVCKDGRDNNCDGGAEGCEWIGGVATQDVLIRGVSGHYAGVGSNMQLVDINSDDILDLVTTGGGQAGAAYFTPRVYLVPDVWTVVSGTAVEDAGVQVLLEEASQPPFVCAGDLDGDGAADLIVDRLPVGGQFVEGIGAYLPAPTTDAGPESLDLTLTAPDLRLSDPMCPDANGDGIVDPAVRVEPVTTPGLLPIGLWFGPISETTQAPPDAHLEPTAQPRRIHWVDVDEDGTTDLVAPDVSNGVVRIFNGPFGAGVFDDGDADTTLTQYGGFGSFIAAGDLDGDGHTDLSIGNPWVTVVGPPAGVSSIDVIAGPLPSGVSASAPTVQLTSASGAYTMIAAGDTDRDGTDDLAVFAEDADRLSLFRGTSLIAGTYSSNDADVSWTGVYRGATPAARVLSLAVGDLNGDDYDDIVLGGSDGSASAVRILWGNGL